LGGAAGALAGGVVGGAGGGLASGLKATGTQILENFPAKDPSTSFLYQPVQDAHVLGALTVGSTDLFALMLADAISHQVATESIGTSGINFTETNAFTGTILNGDGMLLAGTGFFEGILWKDNINSGLLVLGMSTVPGNARGLTINDIVQIDVSSYLNDTHAGQPVSVIAGFVNTTTTVPEPVSVVLLGTGLLGVAGVSYWKRIRIGSKS
jgi:hypothetical protein